MDISKRQFKIVFTNECNLEMNYIYYYISKKLFAQNSAKKLMLKVEKIIQNLKYMPKMYMIIKNYNVLQMKFRRISINKYIIIYTISDEERIVYISHMYYSKSNYLTKT